jgi:16S rRNA (adenine1518-N6/adenine1519-N6)-dimethyltransferase
MTGPAGRPHHRAKRSLGQNFLVDANLQRKIADSIAPSADDEVLEIGPGTGALTRHLVGRVRRLILVELDDSLANRLTADHVGDPRTEVRHADILVTPLESLTPDVAGLKVIGNIPYNITTPIIFHLLEQPVRPAMIVLMVQREVAERILASPGGKTYGALAVGVQSVASVERVLNVGRGAFRPSPDVDSTVIRIIPHCPAPLGPELEVALRLLTRLAFGQRRKQFQRILRDAFSLSPDGVSALATATGMDLTARPETFPPADFIRLASELKTRGLIPSQLPTSRT